ncbi:17786_t:CDS:2, partial [Gigaspora rosea]
RKIYPIPGQGGCADMKSNNINTYYIKKWCDDRPRLGHDHDFEGIIVTWKNISGYWYRDELIMSRHHDWRHAPWNSVASFSYNGTQEGVGLEFPKIYVGWAKHAMFNDKNTDHSDIASQYTDDEYRSDNYQFWANNSLKEVTDDNFYGQNFKKYNWGEATPPTDTAQDLCDK